MCLLSWQMHLDLTYGAYFDFGNHTEKVYLIYFWSIIAIFIGFFLCKFLVKVVPPITTLVSSCHGGESAIPQNDHIWDGTKRL